MPRFEAALKIFVASPSDVAEERDKLEEIVRNINLAWGENCGIRLDLVKWETHAFPGIDVDAQQVINKQIQEDYDCLIAIMWHRCGTPTARAESGTIEEFQRAKARYDGNKNSVKLMVYFKDQPVNPSAIDPSQLLKVNEFKASLGEEGVFFWNFKDLDHFSTLLSLHISRFVQTWTALHGREGGDDHRSCSQLTSAPQIKVRSAVMMT
jgi:hypothetical protein